MTAAVLFLLALLPQLVDRTKEPIQLAPPSRELSYEKRADIYMARKMYREGSKPTNSPSSSKSLLTSTTSWGLPIIT